MFLKHVTLVTGRTVVHRLDTVDPVAVAACRALLPKGGPIPGVTSFSVAVDLPHGFTVYSNRKPIVTCGIGEGRSGNVWNGLLMLQDKTCPRELLRVKAAPPGRWLGVVRHQGAAETDPGNLTWMAEFEKCMAAAILLPK